MGSNRVKVSWMHAPQDRRVLSFLSNIVQIKANLPFSKSRVYKAMTEKMPQFMLFLYQDVVKIVLFDSLIKSYAPGRM